MTLSLIAKYENFDCRNWLFKHKQQEYKVKTPNLTFHRQFNNRRKKDGLFARIIGKISALTVLQ